MQVWQSIAEMSGGFCEMRFESQSNYISKNGKKQERNEKNVRCVNFFMRAGKTEHGAKKSTGIARMPEL